LKTNGDLVALKLILNCHLHHFALITFASTAPSCPNELHHQASDLISATFISRIVNWRNEKMEKLWKINCAISSMSVIDMKTGDGSLDGALAQIFMLDDLVLENLLKRGKLWDGTR
jgi:hypothetical protein